MIFQRQGDILMSKYDVAAYIWPSYTGDEPRTRMFWPEGMGEWQSVKNAVSMFPGHNWPRKPLWGYVNEADPYVMQMEIDCAADHNVNVFIYDWYWFDRRPFLEQCLDNGFLRAANRDRMKFYLMWANHNANNTWDKRINDDQANIIWDGAVDRATFDVIVHRIIDRYFSQPNYYTIGGCPVFMIYDLHNLIRGLGGVEETKKALEYFREETVKAGHPGLNLQLTIWSENAVNLSGVDSGAKGSTKDAVRMLGFDSISHYQFCHFTDVNRDYREILASVREEWKRIDEMYDGIPYFPHISCGWDNTPRFTTLRSSIVRNNTPDAIEEGLAMAKEYVDTHKLPVPLVTVNSWNEWTETSYLEPDSLYGYGYLDAVRKVFGD